MSKIYYDNAASTKISKRALEKMLEVYENDFANPASSHKMGVEASRSIKNSKQIIKDILKAKDNDKIIFTSGGTEANNTAIFGTALRNKSKMKKLLYLNTDHSSIVNSFKKLEEEGMNVVALRVDEKGLIDLNMLGNELKEPCSLISYSFVNGENAVVQDLEKVNTMIKKSNPDCIIHCDAVQGFGKLQLADHGCDLLSLSAHKFHGPKGVGALFIRNGLPLDALILGGGQQEGFRSGTENAPSVAGMAEAALECQESMQESFEKVSEIKQKIVDGIRNILPGSEQNSPTASSPYILNMYLEGIVGENILNMLSDMDVYISKSSACSSKAKQKSHVLGSMGFDDKRANSSIRLSFSRYNSLDEPDEFLKKFEQAVKMLLRVK